MEPLIALVVGFVGALLAGVAGVDALHGWQEALRVGLALMFVVTGVSHFHPATRGQLVAMVPPRMPRPGLLVSVTGVLELAGAAGLLIPATQRAAALCLTLLMLALFPANISAARRRVAQGDPLGPRSLFQLLYISAAVLTLV
ncbi:MauE/DoxX family redox-associated membrane protein [Streptomyces cacaoi]|uniref:Methylamine utilisation protein MauE domain-containing protein n=1 Tax=Streptomyces cacaoi TaxID=1898 RepID=A0A4Y3QY83_STRCI|nr:MauE/DoxX family redox-associated membrane protein [Streptomyces cacaoi]NNG85482.1 DoxX family membrane protein [Streptomyces cacaoi]GEB50201.1 hypothetical protein SCA03_27520 [Streptomyces cacaoi]